MKTINSNNYMNIVICVDHRFVMQCGVLSYSICYNNNDTQIHFFIMVDTSFTEEDKKDVSDIIYSFNDGNQVDYILVEDNLVDNFLWYEKGYYTRQTFYRILMPQLLPMDVDKVLYLDADIIVRHSLTDLWTYNLDGYAVGAVPDGGSGLVKIYNRLKYSIDLDYFNAGVMLINLGYWREKNLSKIMCDYLMDNPDNERSVLGDQDALNYVMRSSKIHLPLKYNVQPMFLYKNKYLLLSIYKYNEELTEARTNPCVLHYAGCRPWEYRCMHPYKKEFFKYQSKTKWKNFPLIKRKYTIKDRIYLSIRKMLAPLGLCNNLDFFDRNLILNQ